MRTKITQTRTVTEEDEGFWRGREGKPSACEELQTSGVLDVSLQPSIGTRETDEADPVD